MGIALVDCIQRSGTSYWKNKQKKVKERKNNARKFFKKYQSICFRK